MKVLTTAQIRQADEYTILHEPIRSIDLMERAAQGLAGRIMAACPREVTLQIFAGFGNNGGDGIAIARILAESGRKVELFVIQADKGFSPDARTNLDRLDKKDLATFRLINSDLEIPPIHPDNLVVDALFGSGLTREPDGVPAAIIDHINRSGARVISVDIPSGLFGEDNRMNSGKHIVKATETLTIEFPKLSLFFPENHQYVGCWTVVRINLHPDFIQKAATPYYFMTEEDIRPIIKKRSKTGHKGNFGHALLITGSAGKGGAAVLAAGACLRTGCGLLTLHVPGSVNPIVQVAVPEAMTDIDSDPDRWTDIPKLDKFDAIGIGPGIGTDQRTGEALLAAITNYGKPMVLDADALNLIAMNPVSMKSIPKNSILTPHPGEYKRLFGDDPDDYSRMERLRQLALQYGLIIILKGAHTTVAGPDGSAWFNTTGNPGMATAGSGDVLTGILTSLLAQGYNPFDAARAGVFLHGLAGDIAAGESSMEALIASDIIDSLGKSFNRIKSNKL
ncbi:MAG: NAD(P)H-hydrate dehydratase [Bacteroidota bacterium]